MIVSLKKRISTETAEKQISALDLYRFMDFFPV